VGTKILTHAKRMTPNAKRTTLSKDYKCDNCGQPAMTKEDDRLRCPTCWLREKGKQIKQLDHTGYYP
jgi:DNA-directed RNA polymerase subunit RPC12/RpoP